MASFCWHSYRLLKAAARNSSGRWTGHATTDRVSIPSYLAFVDAGWTACARVVPGWLHGPFEAVLIMIVKNTVASVRALLKVELEQIGMIITASQRQRQI